ncbi:hypothetical protein [Helicobacter sp. T3_23-1059]
MKKLSALLLILFIPMFVVCGDSKDLTPNSLSVLDSYGFWDKEFFSIDSRDKCAILEITTIKDKSVVIISYGEEITPYQIIDIQKQNSDTYALKATDDRFINISFARDSLTISDSYRTIPVTFDLREAYNQKGYARCEDNEKFWTFWKSEFLGDIW